MREEYLLYSTHSQADHKGGNMKVIKIFNKYMKPFLKEHGFEYKGKRGGDELMFFHKAYDKVLIIYSFETNLRPYRLITEVYGGLHHSSVTTLYLTDLLNGISKVAEVINTGQWYFDTEDELLGILEHHAELFKSYVFDWMLGRRYTDMDVYKGKKVILQQRRERFDNLTKEEAQKIENKDLKIFDEWKRKRFTPVNWKL